MQKTLVIILSLSTIGALVNGASQQEAQNAFNSISSQIGPLMTNLTTTIDAIVTEFTDQLTSTETEIFDAILMMANTTESRIRMIADAAAAAGVDTDLCVNSSIGQVEVFRTRLTQRTQRCSIMSSNTLPFLSDRSQSEANNLQAGIMGCHAITLAECAVAEDGETCYDFFITSAERARDNMVNGFGLITANFVNRITGLRLPCRDIIDFEMITYPNLLIQSVTSCFDSLLQNSVPTTCNDNLN